MWLLVSVSPIPGLYTYQDLLFVAKAQLCVKVLASCALFGVGVSDVIDHLLKSGEHQDSLGGNRPQSEYRN